MIKRVIITFSIFLLYDVMVIMLSARNNFLICMEISVGCVKDDQSPGIGYSIITMCLIIVPVIASAEYEKNYIKLFDLIETRTLVAPSKKFSFMSLSLLKSISIVGEAKAMADIGLCLLCQKEKTISIIKLDILFFLLCCLIYLAGANLRVLKIQQSVIIPVFLICSLFIPTVARTNIMLGDLLVIAKTDYETNFFKSFAVKVTGIILLYVIYLLLNNIKSDKIGILGKENYDRY